MRHFLITQIGKKKWSKHPLSLLVSSGRCSGNFFRQRWYASTYRIQAYRSWILQCLAGQVVFLRILVCLFICMLSNDVLGNPAKDGPPCGGIGRETGHWALALVQDLGQL